MSLAYFISLHAVERFNSELTYGRQLYHKTSAL